MLLHGLEEILYREKLFPRPWMYDLSRFGKGNAFQTGNKVFLDRDQGLGNNRFIYFAIIYEWEFFQTLLMCAVVSGPESWM